MIYLLCSNKILELDLKFALLKAGYRVKVISILELLFLKYEADDVLIISNNIVENTVTHNLTGLDVILISELPYKYFLKINYPSNYHYIKMPLQTEELLLLLKEIFKE